MAAAGDMAGAAGIGREGSQCCPTCGQAISGPLPLFDSAAQTVTSGNTQVSLTRMEAKVLASLANAYPSIARGSDIMDATHPAMNYQPHAALKVRIFHLRRKLRAVGVEIRTVPGSGYRLVTPVRQRGKVDEPDN